MRDITYCSCEDCPQKDCIRNLKFHKPIENIYWLAFFDKDSEDKTHKNCEYKLLRRI